MKGFVHIVGAGCGSADLITVRGRELLSGCQVLIYDALIDPALTELVPVGAEKIAAGKRAGHHSAAQESICELIAARAMEGKTVVRLKGGDPFVFGRGGEEILFLQEKGIPYDITPGISSCVAAPELAGVPVTHRKLSRGFHVMTVHTAEGDAQLSQCAKLEGTLVFLMGAAKAGLIARSLIEGGMSPTTPAAFISRGGTPEQRSVKGPLFRLEELSAGLEPPAVIVVGGTADLDLAARYRASVTVTGTAAFEHKLCPMLRNCGFEVKELPTAFVEEMDFDLPELSDYGYLVLTSVTGARIFLNKLGQEHIDLRSLSDLKLAVIGSGTAAVLEQRGLYPDLLPETYTAGALGRALAKSSKGSRVLILRAEKGSPALTEELERGGIAFDEIKTYRVTGGQAAAVETDFLVFASGSGARAFFENGGSVGKGTRILCIGPSTGAALKEYRDDSPIIPKEYTAEGIVKALLQETEEK